MKAKRSRQPAKGLTLPGKKGRRTVSSGALPAEAPPSPLPAGNPGPGPQPEEGQGKSFYFRVLDESEKVDFEKATGIEGIDEEIALLRVKIKSALQDDSNNLKLVMKATSLLANLIKTRHSITKEQKKGLKDAIRNVVKDIAVPLGVAAITKKL